MSQKGSRTLGTPLTAVGSLKGVQVEVCMGEGVKTEAPFCGVRVAVREKINTPPQITTGDRHICLHVCFMHMYFPHKAIF